MKRIIIGLVGVVLIIGSIMFFSKEEKPVLITDKQELDNTSLVFMLQDEEGNYVDENTLAVTIRRLRVKVETDPGHPERIRTVHGQGYRWQEMDR